MRLQYSKINPKNLRRLMLYVTVGLWSQVTAPVVFATSIHSGAFKPLGNVTLQSVIGRLFFALAGFSGVIALAMFVYGGVMWMTSAGNQERISKAKKTMVWSTLGLFMIFMSYAIVKVIVGALGQE